MLRVHISYFVNNTPKKPANAEGGKDMKTLREEAIAQMVLNKLREDQRTCGQTIDVTVVEGDIFLVGYCDTEEQRKAAEMLARGT